MRRAALLPFCALLACSQPKPRPFAAPEPPIDAAAPSIPEQGFDAYVVALQGPWSDDVAAAVARVKLMRLIAVRKELAPPPAEAKRHVVRAQASLKLDEELADYRTAEEEYKEAIGLAPWTAEYYRELGYVQERLGRHADALRNLELYLLASPAASDADAVNDKIEALRLRIQRGN